MGDKRRFDPPTDNAMMKNAMLVDKVDIEHMMIFWLAGWPAEVNTTSGLHLASTPYVGGKPKTDSFLSSGSFRNKFAG